MAFAPYALLAILQVTAGTAVGSDGRTEIPDPMQIEVSLGADVDLKGNPREPFNQQPLGKARAYPGTDRFRVRSSTSTYADRQRVAETPTEVVIEASPTLISEWPLQDVDLTVSLIGNGGQVIGKQFLDNLTLGAWSRSYEPLKAEFKRWRRLQQRRNRAAARQPDSQRVRGRARRTRPKS